MRIAAISDLHVDINRDYPVLESLRDEVDRYKQGLPGT